MSKSIASKALAIAKKQEAERLESIKKDFLNIMRNEFEKRVLSCDPWTAVGTVYYIYREEFKEFSSHDLEIVCKDVGFSLQCHHYSAREISLSIPEWLKGQKRTQAQLMLYWSNIEINRKIKSQKDQARKISKEVLQKIKDGDFESTNQFNGYRISVLVTSPFEKSKNFKDDATRFFAKRNIKLIDIGNNIWIFDI